jgi:hypothetical protein
MRLEKKDQEVLAARKGLTLRTIIQVIWLLLSFAIAYVLLNVLEDQGIFSYPQLRRTLTLSSDVPDWAILVALMLIIVIIMQFILFLAFALTSPEGRRRTGTPSMHSRSKDPFDDSDFGG